MDEEEVKQVIVEIAGGFASFTPAYDVPLPDALEVVQLIEKYLLGPEQTTEAFCQLAQSSYAYEFPERRGWQVVRDLSTTQAIPNFGYTNQFFECYAFVQVLSKDDIRIYTCRREWEAKKPVLQIAITTGS